MLSSLEDAISNITIAVTPAQTTRERLNADEIASSGFEIEGDVRPHQRVTLSLFGAFTSAHYTNTPKQPAIQDRRVPQVPRYHLGAAVMAEPPRVATFSVQARFVGDQFEDDLNTLVLERYAVADASAKRPLTRQVQLNFCVENLFDVEYNVARTNVRSIGWPLTVRAGLRMFMPCPETVRDPVGRLPTVNACEAVLRSTAPTTRTTRRCAEGVL